MLIQLNKAELRALRDRIKHKMAGRVAAKAGIHPTMLSKMLAGNYTKTSAMLIDSRVFKAVDEVEEDMKQENEQRKKQFI